MKFIGRKLTRLREVMKLTQKDVERLTGIKSGHISDIENGKRDPRKETVEKLCKGLKIAEQYFYLEDSTLPVDILPSMPPALEKFISDGNNIPWLVLTEKAKKDGVSLETLTKIINALSGK